MLDFLNGKNAHISMVTRGGSIDRYGVSAMETVFSQVPVRIEKSTGFKRGVGGDTIDISGTLYLGPSVELKPKDIITVDNASQDQYTIFDVSEHLDIQGIIVYRSYSLQLKTKI